MTTPGEETLTSAHGTEDQAMQATWHVTVTDTESAKAMTNQSADHNDPNTPGTSLSPTVRASTFTGWHTTGHQTPCTHRTLIADPHLHAVIFKGQYHDQDHILLTPVHRLLATRAQPSQSLTASLGGDSNGLE